MAVTENTFTGNGSTTLYSFTFPYLEEDEIKVSLNGTPTTAYTLANATTVSFNTAPANGVAIRIYRQTDNTSTKSTFFAGSAIRAQDLNENFLQTLYVSQESDNIATSAEATANTALTNSATAISTANTASTNASAAVSTANTASANASAAVSTANTASTNASSAVATANTASTNASTALTAATSAASDASTALSTANTALTNANAAVSTANTASTNASNAVSTANTASTNATNAVNTANTASTNASNAVTTANSAVTTANAAAAAVANAVLYTTVANVAAIPGSPSNNDAVEVTDSTGIESFTPLSGLPGGFVGSSGLAVRLIYQTTGATWTWIQYFPNDPENRYLTLSGGTLTGQLRGDDSTSAATPGFAFDGDANTGMGRPGADELALITGGTARLTIDSTGNVAVGGALTTGGSNVVTVGDTGTVTSAMIADGTIVNADVSASAAIAGTKVSPDFGSQNVTTTGTVTGASLSPTSSTVPSNGVYLPAANSVAISTNGTGRLTITAGGDVNIDGAQVYYNKTSTSFGVGTESPEAKFEVRGSAGSGAAVFTGVSGRGLLISNTTVGVSSAGSVLNARGAGNGTLILQTDSNERLRIDSSGRVGIGTTSPRSLLSFGVADTSGTNGINFYDNGGNYRTGIGGAVNYLRFYAPSDSGTIQFGTLSTANGSTFNEAARIDSSGRLLIGTSSARSNFFRPFSATAAVQVEGTSFNLSTFSAVRNSNDSGPSYFILGKSRGTANASNTIVQSGDSIGAISFQGTDGGDFTEAARITAEVDGTPGTADMPGRLVFLTTADGSASPTERMRITREGYLKYANGGSYRLTGTHNEITSNNDSQALVCYNNSNSFNSDLLAAVATRNTTNNTFSFFGCYNDTAAAYRFRVADSGNCTNTNNSYTGISDIKLKENIVDANSQWQDIQALQVRNYNFKEETGQPTHRQIGLISQEVELVSPGLVAESPDRDAEGNDLGTVTKSVNYSVLYMKAVKALQEAMERIETLEQRLNDAGIN